jgi:hypothetical protein
MAKSMNLSHFQKVEILIHKSTAIEKSNERQISLNVESSDESPFGRELLKGCTVAEMQHLTSDDNKERNRAGLFRERVKALRAGRIKRLIPESDDCP